jgi:hypothetical protein
MKKLLLITTILLSVNCFSQSKFEKEFQDADSAFSLKFEFSKPCEWLRINQDTSKVKIVGAELITIKLLMKYKTECFNDSTRLYEWSCWEGAGIELTINNNQTYISFHNTSNQSTGSYNVGF